MSPNTKREKKKKEKKKPAWPTKSATRQWGCDLRRLMRGRGEIFQGKDRRENWANSPRLGFFFFSPPPIPGTQRFSTSSPNPTKLISGGQSANEWTNEWMNAAVREESRFLSTRPYNVTWEEVMVESPRTMPGKGFFTECRVQKPRLGIGSVTTWYLIRNYRQNRNSKSKKKKERKEINLYVQELFSSAHFI